MKLRVEKLSKRYGSHHALNEASFEIPDCKILAILGPSGSGKSTLLRLMGGLETPDSGSITFDKNKLLFTPTFLLNYRRQIGFVFQSFNLFPHLTVAQNIELPLHHVHQFPLQEAKEIALQFLSRFGLEEQAHKKPSQLSGGQRQRVAIVRAIAIKARLLLLDEPTSALDPVMTSEVLDLILELRSEGCNIIMVSHHIGFVKKAADWILYTDLGKVLESAPTAQFFSSPQTEQAKKFLEKILKY